MFPPVKRSETWSNLAAAFLFSVVVAGTFYLTMNGYFKEPPAACILTEGSDVKA